MYTFEQMVLTIILVSMQLISMDSAMKLIKSANAGENSEGYKLLMKFIGVSLAFIFWVGSIFISYKICG
jgi:hypothetical protein